MSKYIKRHEGNYRAKQYFVEGKIVSVQVNGENVKALKSEFRSTIIAFSELLHPATVEAKRYRTSGAPMKPSALALLMALGLGIAGCAGPRGPTAGPLGSAQFVSQATVSNTFEIETSRLALARSRRPDVRRFAQEMISDHTAAARRMAVVLRSSGQAPAAPVMLDAPHRAMVEDLQSTAPGGFDRAYIDMQANAHGEAIALFSSYASSGDNPALAQFARNTLPVLQMHAQHVRSLEQM
jgi:putative membrane protein